MWTRRRKTKIRRRRRKRKRKRKQENRKTLREPRLKDQAEQMSSRLVLSGEKRIPSVVGFEMSVRLRDCLFARIAEGGMTMST